MSVATLNVILDTLDRIERALSALETAKGGE